MADHVVGEEAVVREAPRRACYGLSVEIARKGRIAVQLQKAVNFPFGPDFTLLLI